VARFEGGGIRVNGGHRVDGREKKAKHASLTIQNPTPWGGGIRQEAKCQ